MAKQQIQTLGNFGGGVPPGFQWNVLSLNLAYRESEKCLNDGEREHMANLCRQLAMEEDPSHSELCDVRVIGDFLELRDTGGPLGGKNVRLFFAIDKENNAIVLLGLILKQNNGKTPEGDRIRVARRWRKYLAGEYA